MASELEVARLVVRLLGDSSEFIKPMKDAKDVTDSLTKAVSDVAREAKKSAEAPIVTPATVSTVREAKAAVDELAESTKAHAEHMARFQREMQRPLEELKERVEAVEEEYRKMDEAGSKSAKAMAVIGAGMASVGAAILAGVTPLLLWGKTALDAFIKTEDSIDQLTATLRSNGREVNSLIEKYNLFASRMAGAHDSITKNAAREMVRLAETMGLTGYAAERAAENAIGLNAQLGIGEKAAVRMAAQLENGSVSMLKRHLPALKDVKNESQAVALAQRELAKMVEASALAGDTIAGKLQFLSKEYNDLKVSIGSIIAEAYEPLIDTTREFVAWLNDMPRSTKVLIVQVVALTAALGALLVVVGTVIAGFAGLELALAAVGMTVGGLAVMTGGIALAIVALGAAVYATYQYLYSDYNKTIAESRQLTEEWLSSTRSINSAIVDQANAMEGAAKKNFLADQIEAAKNETQQLTDRLAIASKELNDIGSQNSAKGVIAYWTGEMGVAVENVEQLNTKLEEQQGHLRNLLSLKAADQGLKQMIDPELLEKFHKRAMEIEQDNLTAQEKHKQSLEELRVLRNAGVFEGIRGQEIYNRAVEKAGELLDKEVNGKAREEALRAQKKLQEEIARVTEDTLTPYEAYIQKTEHLKQLLSQGLGQEAFTRAMKEAHEEFKKAFKTEDMKKAEKIFEQFKTPLQKFKDKVMELQELRDKGLIDAGTQNRAFAEARKQFDDLTKDETKTIKLKFGGIDAVEAGSAEALARFQEYAANRRTGDPQKALPAGITAPAQEAIRVRDNPLRRDQGGMIASRAKHEEAKSKEADRLVNHSSVMAQGISRMVQLMEEQEKKQAVTIETAGFN